MEETPKIDFINQYLFWAKMPFLTNALLGASKDKEIVVEYKVEDAEE